MKDRMINLPELDNQTVEIQEAAAFYASFGFTPTAYSKEQRQHFYSVLENAGLFEKVGEFHGAN